MLNELEVVYWQLLNKRVGIIDVSNDLILQRLMMTALKAKQITLDRESIRVYETFLRHNYPKFIQSYIEWDEE